MTFLQRYSRAYAEEFHEFIDGSNGMNFGLEAWMYISREIKGLIKEAHALGTSQPPGQVVRQSNAVTAC